MQKSFKRRMVTPATGSHFVVNGFRVVVAEYRVERNQVDLVAGPLGVDEARECPGVTELSDHYRATIGFEYDDAAPGESLGHSLIDAQRNDVTKINGAAMVAQHATFDDDSLVRDVHLVRAPSPRARECDHGKAGLIRLQMSDHVPIGSRQIRQGASLPRKLLHPVLPEQAKTGSVGLSNAFGRMCFGHRHQHYLF